MKPNFHAILLCIFLLSLAFADKQIDTFNILFPEAYKQSSGKSIELVTTEGGCFDWTSSSPEVVAVTGVSGDDTKCFRKGIVQHKYVGAYPASVYITATNTKTQELSNIPVRIRPITRIQIIAKSKLMNINEIQDLSIFAYDKDHNMFTSLEGLKFEWQLVQNSNILSKISLKNSNLILPLNQRRNIEMKGAESDILVIRGDNPGKAIVRVKCVEPGYEQLQHQITVSVHERFDINPALPTYVMINSVFKFGLITPSRQDILIPKSYYKTTLSSPNFHISDTLILNTPTQQDETVLKVEDIRTVPPYSADVMVFAKEPTSMNINLDDYLIVGEQAKVDIIFFWNKHLLQGSNADVQVSSDLPYDSLKRTIKGSQKRSANIKISYKHLSAEKKVNVVYPLKQVLPSNKIILPIEETFELKIVGGSGVYEYKVQGGDFATISASGVINARKQGNAKVIVIDKRIPRNKLTLDLLISSVYSLSPLEVHKQLNVNEYGPVFTVGKTKDYEQYTKCSEQSIVLETSHLPIFETNSEISFFKSMRFLQAKTTQSTVVRNALMKNALLPLGIDDFVSKFFIYTQSGEVSVEQLTRYARQLENYGICSSEWIKGSQHYDEIMEVYFKSNSQVRSKFNLRVYEKISNNVNKQGDQSFIMTPLSTLDWKTIGGSYKWDTKTRTLLNDIQYSTQYPTVRCPDKESVMEMKIQKINSENSKLLFPVNQTRKIYIQCKYPTQIKIQYQNPVFDTKNINGLRDQVVKGKLLPFDVKGQQFYNSSNLIYEFEKSAGILQIRNDQFQFDQQGVQSAKVVFWTQKIKDQPWKFAKVIAEFSYNGQEMFQISPLPQNYHLVTLFNQKTPYIFRLIKISQNSLVTCEGSIECQYLISPKQVNVKTSRLGPGKMIVTDKSIYGYPNLIITFEVVDSDRIVLSINKKSAQVQKKLIAEIHLFYQDKLIPTWQYDFRNLLLVHEAGIRSKETITGMPSGPSNNYEISTEKPGLYKIVAEQHYPKYMESTPVLLKVYPRFEVNIPNLVQTYTSQDILHLKGQLIVAVNCARKIHLYGGPDFLSVTSQVQNDDYSTTQITNDYSRQILIHGVQQGKTYISFTVKSTTEDKLIIAFIDLQVTIKQIDEAKIYSLADAVVNAQFRVIPYLIIDGEVMVDSLCDFQYKWTSGEQILLRGFNSKRLGINATAISQGDSSIKLEVIKNGKHLFESQKTITIHKSLDIELPTIIGQRKNAISTNLLLPQNSGIDLHSNIYATKISECDENMLSINQNKLITSVEKGMVSIKLQKINDDTYSNYMNVIVTQIKALFIQNSYSKVVAEMGKVTRVKFYVQDMYGRLFYNNLFNVDYDIISSNEDVFTVSIDSSKDFINIHPKKEGQANLIIRLQSFETKSGYQKLMEIPHDIVSVEVGKIIEPQSPIYLVVGGEVDIQYSGKGSAQWTVVNGGKLIQFNPISKKITALHEGQAILSIGGHEVIVRIVKPIIKKKVIQKLVPGKVSLVVEYLLSGRWNNEDLWFSSISNSYGNINNNMNLKCVGNSPQFFNVKTEFQRDSNRDKLKCIVEMNHNIQPSDQFPASLELTVVDFSDKNHKVLHKITEIVKDTFWLPSSFKQIFLSSKKPKAQLFIKTQEKLIIDVINGQKSWLQELFEKQENIQVLSLEVQAKDENFEFKIRISHPNTDQVEDIIVKYITDERTLNEEEAIQNEKREDQKEAKSQGKSFNLMGLLEKTHWTDYIILIMAVLFFVILASQKCISSDGEKYHTY